MADITEQHDQTTTAPTELDETHSVGNGTAAVNENRGIKRARPNSAEEEEEEDEKGGRERRKIEIKFISDKSRRHITFSKRKAGIMKKVCFFFFLVVLRRPPTSRASTRFPLPSTSPAHPGRAFASAPRLLPQWYAR